MKRMVLIGLVLTLAITTAPAAAPEPLTYANIVSHFKAAEMRAIQVQKRCTVFLEGEWASPNIYSYALIVVENSDEDVQVTFYLTDAHEMNWVTEFLDAPFFTRSETTTLFDLLHSGPEVRDRQVGRFRVDFNHWQPKHAEIFVFSFSSEKPR
jgi:hypothetical protein